MATRTVCFSKYLNLLNLSISTLRHSKTYIPGSVTSVCSVALSYKARPERLDEIARSPSGWVPPQNIPPSLPFQIRRSKTNNLPVYIDKKRGGSLVLTVVRNIKGDLNELLKLIKERLGEDVHIQTNEITSQVKVKGYHKEAIVGLLKEHGF